MEEEENPDDENPTLIYVIWAFFALIILYSLIR